jgi:hypothetical protein
MAPFYLVSYPRNTHLVVKAREPLLTKEHLYLVEGFGLPVPELCGWYRPLLATYRIPRVWNLPCSPSKCTASESLPTHIL